MKKIKVSIPGLPSNLSVQQYIGNDNNVYEDYKFYLNQEIEKPDYWFVLESLDKVSVSCSINPKNIIYLNTETSYPKDYFTKNYMKSYMNQFALKYGCYGNSDYSYNVNLPFLPWLINSQNNISAFSKSENDINFFKNLKSLKKNKKLSVICSNKTYTDDHIARLNFVYTLKEYFQNNLDWFGVGVNDIRNKWEGIAEYKYHIVLENDSRNNLVSEKLYDSFLGLAYPFYYGAPNLSSYFPYKSFSEIDIMDYKKSINVIEEGMNKSLYENCFDDLLESKDLVLTKYNFVFRILDIVKSLNTDINNRSDITLYNVGYFWNKEVNYKNKIKHQIKRRLRINVNNY